MNDIQARAYVVNYLKERNIFYQHIRGGGSLVVGLTGLEHCPGELLESSFDFYQTCMEARVYFGESVSGWLAENANRWPQLYRLLNYINAKYWPFSDDWAGGSLYSPSCLVTPRFCLTEGGEGRDLMAIMAVSYDLFELAPLEVCDYITATLPARINEDLSFPLISVLLGIMNDEEAISMIRDNEC